MSHATFHRKSSHSSMKSSYKFHCLLITHHLDNIKNWIFHCFDNLFKSINVSSVIDDKKKGWHTTQKTLSRTEKYKRQLIWQKIVSLLKVFAKWRSMKQRKFTSFIITVIFTVICEVSESVNQSIVDYLKDFLWKIQIECQRTSMMIPPANNTSFWRQFLDPRASAYQITSSYIETCQGRQAPGFVCTADCSSLARCVFRNNVWETIPLQRCDAGQGLFCNANEQACSRNPGPCNPGNGGGW